ncbi:hypothetical protein [Streptomyces sp. NPDC054958]
MKQLKMPRAVAYELRVSERSVAARDSDGLLLLARPQKQLNENSYLRR